MANNLIDDKGRLNQANYDKKRQKQQETFANIDATMAILEKMPDLVDVGLDFMNAESYTYAENPLSFLFNILKALGVEEDELKKWITEILTGVLPAIELGVKGALLANIKAIISCEYDPRIPWWLRKRAGDNVYIDLFRDPYAERGYIIPVSLIDPEGILDLSPFTSPGQQYYFGQSEDLNEDSRSKIARLARADDFNAFLWYIIHKGNRQNPIAVVIGESGVFTYGGNTYTADTQSMKGVVNVKCELGKEFIEGTTFCDAENPQEVLICIEKEERRNKLIPLSSDWMSCNWYVDKDQYYTNNISGRTDTDEHQRHYEKEKPICNLCYTALSDYKGADVKAPVGLDNILFTVLPKPAVIIPTIDVEDTAPKEEKRKVRVNWRVVRLLFDADGTPNSKGKYSLPGEISPKVKKLNDEWSQYDYDGAIVNFNRKTGQYEFQDIDNGVKHLIECYPGLTVYEFNYDYVMGMKLFDTKTVCNKVLASATNSKYTAAFSLTLNKQKNKTNYALETGKQRVTEIVRKILESDEEEYNDCFYTFSNEEYDELLRKTAELKYHQSPYTEGYGDGQVVDLSDVDKILANYPANGTLQEQKEVISHAIETACAVLEDSMPPEYNDKKSSVRINFLTNVLQQLALCLVDCIMSPKVLMLLEINNVLMTSEEGVPTLTTDQLIALAKNVVTSLIKELRDLIMQKILDYIVEFLTPMILEIQAFVTSEQVGAYMAIMRLLLDWFNKGLMTANRLNAVLESMMSKFKNGNYDGDNYEIPTVLDDVNYADIYTTKSEKTPIINDCNY